MSKAACGGERSSSLRLGATSLSLAEDSLDVDEVANLGGVGLAWRWGWSPRSAIELELGLLERRSTNEFMEESSALVGLSYVRRWGQRWYGSVGWMGVASQRRFDGQQLDYLEKGWTLGLGRDWRWGKRWVLSADARVVGLKLVEKTPAEPVIERGRFEAEDGSVYPASFVEVAEKRVGISARATLGYQW